MYDRAPRHLTSGSHSTGPNVGPGTYENLVPTSAKLRADGYAPFSSMTRRETFLTVQDSVIAAPGPGQYDPLVCQDRIVGGRTLANRSQRFQETQFNKSKTPGPGSYNLSKSSDWIKKVSYSENDTRPSGNLTSSTSRVRYQRQAQAPSIPTPGQSYGYEENEDGVLKKQDPPDRDNSMGPAFYNVLHDKTKATKKYKGVHFGNMASQRMDFSGNHGPGPGEYNPHQVKCMETELMKAKDGTRVFDSKLPRYHEMIVQEVEKKAVPGPGKYQINSQFDITKPSINTEGLEVEHPPFMSQSKRFFDPKNKAPAPGTYNDPRHALEVLKRTRGLKKSPFGQTALRFTTEPHIQKTPGPGSYNFRGIAQDSVRKAYVESTRRGAFGSTSVRIKPITKQTEAAQPGPAHYQVKDKPDYSRYSQNISANFSSQTNRLHSPPPIIKDVPPPGSYEVSKSYDRTQAKVEPAPPRSVIGKRKKGSFLSSSSRFAQPRDMIIEKPESANPGPGTYQPEDSRGNVKLGMMVYKDSRFKEHKNENPGPGAYEMSPLIQDTVLKGTFNATLNNPVAPRMDITESRSNTKQAFMLGV
ncbi:sperm-tail PG-rich repeat-containing protein 2-like [Anneissia japonica]|uniref:sperm-tail PG-rich repeat-containing protein 2-like n=1 Tax=Anneissia japonica TaxID=1529436 RepID=UPI001425A694|nr:sperm-tail PG-rich repeat-containing protein 2-like [Anneissia japonica]